MDLHLVIGILAGGVLLSIIIDSIVKTRRYKATMRRIRAMREELSKENTHDRPH